MEIPYESYLVRLKIKNVSRQTNQMPPSRRSAGENGRRAQSIALDERFGIRYTRLLQKKGETLMRIVSRHAWFIWKLKMD